MTLALLALMEEFAAAMTPLESVLAVCSLVAFVLACFGFLALVWKISWTLSGYVAAEHEHAKGQQELIKVFGQFVETQREANGHLLENQRLQAARLDRFDEEREDVHRSIRAMNRKLLYIEGEDATAEQHSA